MIKMIGVLGRERGRRIRWVLDSFGVNFFFKVDGKEGSSDGKGVVIVVIWSVGFFLGFGYS